MPVQHVKVTVTSDFLQHQKSYLYPSSNPFWYGVGVTLGEGMVEVEEVVDDATDKEA